MCACTIIASYATYLPTSHSPPTHSSLPLISHRYRNFPKLFAIFSTASGENQKIHSLADQQHHGAFLPSAPRRSCMGCCGRKCTSFVESHLRVTPTGICSHWG